MLTGTNNMADLPRVCLFSSCIRSYLFLFDVRVCLSPRIWSRLHTVVLLSSGGTLSAKIAENSKEDKVFTQLELQRLIVHIAKVSKNLVRGIGPLFSGHDYMLCALHTIICL